MMVRTITPSACVTSRWIETEARILFSGRA